MSPAITPLSPATDQLDPVTNQLGPVELLLNPGATAQEDPDKLDECAWVKLFEEEVVHLSRNISSRDTIQRRTNLVYGEIVKRVRPGILKQAVASYLGLSAQLITEIQICSAIRQVLFKILQPRSKRRRNLLHRPYSSTVQVELEPLFELDLDRACQEGLITTSQLNSICQKSGAMKFFLARLPLNSSDQPQITLREHLVYNSMNHPEISVPESSSNNLNSSDMHSNIIREEGQIYRFEEYSSTGDKMNYPIFIAIHPTAEDFESIGMKYQPVDIQGQYQLTEDALFGPNVTTSTDLNAVPGIVKEIRAGWARPDRIDSLEVDYVGDFTMTGYVYQVVLEDQELPDISATNEVALEILSRLPQL